MGRRALPKIDPALDLARHHRTLDELPQPFSTEVLFGRSAPLEIEMGSGKGLFVQTAATRRPDHDFLGIEISRKFARFAASRLARAALPNAIMVQGDGLRLFRELLPECCAAAVHVYFPDPWWKKRHHKRRVMNEAFCRDIERVLLPGGQLHFWTDVEEYFVASLEVVRQATQLTGPMEVSELPAEHDLDYRTHFERRMRMHDAPVYRSLFEKAAG